MMTSSRRVAVEIVTGRPHRKSQEFVSAVIAAIISVQLTACPEYGLSSACRTGKVSNLVVSTRTFEGKMTFDTRKPVT